MSIKLKFRSPEIFFGLLLAVAIFAMGGIFCSSSAANNGLGPEHSSQSNQQSGNKDATDSDKTQSLWVWFYCNLVYLDFMQNRHEAGFCWERRQFAPCPLWETRIARIAGIHRLIEAITPCHNFIDICPRLRDTALRISLTSGTSTGDSRWMGRVRFLRAGLVTPLPGGLGSANKCTQFAQVQTAMPAGSTTDARGAPLKRDRRRG